MDPLRSILWIGDDSSDRDSSFATINGMNVFYTLLVTVQEMIKLYEKIRTIKYTNERSRSGTVCVILAILKFF